MRLPDAERSRAVLIGTSTYAADSGLDALPEIRTNLTRLERVLRQHTGMRHVRVVLDPESRKDFALALAPAVDEAEDLLLLFYFAGHGLIFNNDLALTHTGSSTGSPGYTALPYPTVRDDVRRSGARIKVVILDCCHSGKAISSGGLLAGDEDFMRELASIEGAYVLTATDTKRKFARSGWPGGCTAFTGAFLEVLKEGTPSSDEFLSLSTMVPLLRQRLRGAGCPSPADIGRDSARHLALVRNAARVTVTDREPREPNAQLVLEHLVVGSQSAASATWLQRGSGRALVAEFSGRVHEWPEPKDGRRWPELPGTIFLSSDRTGHAVLAGHAGGVWVVGRAGSRTLWTGSDKRACFAACICECSRHVALGILEMSRTTRSAGRFEIIDLTTMHRRQLQVGTTWPKPNHPSAVAFSRDCSLLALSSRTAMELVDLASMARTTLQPQSGWATEVAFDQARRLVARSTRNGWIQVWDVASGSELYCQQWDDAVLSVDVDPVRGIVAFGTEHGAHVVSLATKVMLHPVDLARCRSIALRDDGVLAVVGSRNTDAGLSIKRLKKTWNVPESALLGPVIICSVKLPTVSASDSLR